MHDVGICPVGNMAEYDVPSGMGVLPRPSALRHPLRLFNMDASLSVPVNAPAPPSEKFAKG